MEKTKKVVEIGNIKIGGNSPLVLIAGPCVVEDKKTTNIVAEELSRIQNQLNIPVIFKSSYKKANRTSLSSFTGIGMKQALKILEGVKKAFGFPILTDIHANEECDIVSQIVDVLQIPAFLCRQTELIQAAGGTGRVVNVKKGQFLSPDLIGFQAEKAIQAGASGVMLTERGTMFGYDDIIVDMRSIVVMRKYGYPIIFDATHSVQKPGKGGDRSGGHPEFSRPLARAAIAVGCDALYLETHPEPDRAKSDAATQIPLRNLEELVDEALTLHQTMQKRLVNA